jgi:2'-phosphotransferase
MLHNKVLYNASRKLTKILRHQVLDFGLDMDSEGYIKLNDIISIGLKEFKDLEIEHFVNIVENNNKKRLDLKLNSDGIYLIRANQGHSDSIGKHLSDDLAFETINTPLEEIFHGTERKFLESILQDGLNKMSRSHIHLVENIDREKQISGFKKISNILIKVDMKQCMEDGMIFYRSKNDVILTKGFDGIIDPKYFIEIIEI